jgi:hypothetical protein
MINDAKERLYQFKEDLSVLSPSEMVRRHVITGKCCILSENQYFDLRSEVADCFKLHPSEVLVVGSAKLGFSIAPDKLYQQFSDGSDIDVVLISSTLFDEIWEVVFRYKYEGGYWPEYEEFVKYFFQGWIRPDKLPRSEMFPFGRKWWGFFQKVTNSRIYGDYKIAGALYKSYFFLENYQKHCVQQCMSEKDVENLEEHDAGISGQ